MLTSAVQQRPLSLLYVSLLGSLMKAKQFLAGLD